MGEMANGNEITTVEETHACRKQMTYCHKHVYKKINLLQ